MNSTTTPTNDIHGVLRRSAATAHVEDTLTVRLFTDAADCAGADGLWRDFVDACHALTGGHLWQLEPLIFERIPFSSAGPTPAAVVLGSAVCVFGDCTSDEWFIVSVLATVSKSFPAVAVVILDNDGHFILAECAEALPKWLEPETSDYRVFLCGGDLHLVAPTLCQESKIIASEEEGAAFVLGDLFKTQASVKIQALFQQRTARAHDEASQRHRACCCLPEACARLLRRHPQLLGPAVEAVYARDARSMRVARGLQTFNPSAGAGLITLRVAFSRVQYAKLTGIKISPMPEVFATALEKFNACNSTKRQNANKDDEDDEDAQVKRFQQQQKEEDIGMKLTLGLEMLARADGVFGKRAYKYDAGGRGLVFESSRGQDPSRTCTIAELIRRHMQESCVDKTDALTYDFGPSDSESWMQLDEADVERWVAGSQTRVLDGAAGDAGSRSCGLGHAIDALERFGSGTSGIAGFDARNKQKDGKDKEKDINSDSDSGGDSDSENDDNDEYDSFDTDSGDELFSGSRLLRDIYDDLGQMGTGLDSGLDEDLGGLAADSNNTDARQQMEAEELLRGLEAESENGKVGPLGTLLASMGIWVPGAETAENNGDE